jgi:hypothetical protein
MYPAASSACVASARTARTASGAATICPSTGDSGTVWWSTVSTRWTASVVDAEIFPVIGTSIWC